MTTQQENYRAVRAWEHGPQTEGNNAIANIFRYVADRAKAAGKPIRPSLEHPWIWIAHGRLCYGRRDIMTQGGVPEVAIPLTLIANSDVPYAEMVWQKIQTGTLQAAGRAVIDSAMPCTFGDRVVPAVGTDLRPSVDSECHTGTVVGQPIMIGTMGWTPVLWDNEEDPTFQKTTCLAAKDAT